MAIKFDDAPDSKAAKSVDTAGVHRNYKVEGFEFVTKNKEGKTADKPYLRLTLKGENDQFIAMVFCPPTHPDEVKFTSKKWENNVEVGKLTKEEEIEMQFLRLFYFYQQLGMALNAPKDKLEAWKKSAGGEPEELFKKLYDTFTKAFPLEKYGKNPIDFKVVFSNNDVKKTSFLNLCRPSASNMIFGPYIAGQPSLLQLNSNEEKNTVRKWKPSDSAPKTDDPEVEENDSAAGNTSSYDDGMNRTPIADSELF